jgi:hypothetical protein
MNSPRKTGSQEPCPVPRLAPHVLQNIDINVQGASIQSSCMAVFVEGEDDADPIVSIGQGPVEDVFPALWIG